MYTRGLHHIPGMSYRIYEHVMVKEVSMFNFSDLVPGKTIFLTRKNEERHLLRTIHNDEYDNGGDDETLIITKPGGLILDYVVWTFEEYKDWTIKPTNISWDAIEIGHQYRTKAGERVEVIGFVLHTKYIYFIVPSYTGHSVYCAKPEEWQTWSKV